VLAYGLALAGGVLALSAANGWTFAFALGPLRVSLRNPTNPAAAGVFFFGFSCWWLGAGGLRSLGKRVERIAVAVAALGLALWQRWAYGSTTETGYGAVGTLFSTANV
jgi:hypothetical protein